MLRASNAKDNKRKINKLYLLGDDTKTLKCYLFGVLKRTSTEIFAWPVPPQLLNYLPLSPSVVSKCFYGCLTTAGWGRDSSLNSTQCLVLGLLVEGFQEMTGQYVLGLSGNAAMKRAGPLAEVAY